MSREEKRVQDHGGDIYGSVDGVPVLCDFSASINPLGQPDGMKEAVFERWAEVLHYPDRKSSAVLAAFAARYGVEERRLVVGNGSAELIELTLRALAPRRLVVAPPDFSLYESLAPPHTEIHRLPRVEARGFALDVAAVERHLEQGDLLLFSNPGNPSGALLSREETLSLARLAHERGATLVVDEAFADYAPECSLLGVAGKEPGVALLRSLTKFHGIPGLRLGVLAAEEGLVRKVAALQVPWSVNTVAQVAGAHCLADDNWEVRSREYLQRARAKFVAELERLPGFAILPSAANYLLIRLDPPAPDADLLFAKLRREGTLIRHCGSFGLGSRYVRVAVRTVGENANLIRLMRKLFGWPEGGAP